MDDKGRKIAFKGPNENHRNDGRWKIESFAQGAELSGSGVSFRTWTTGKKNVSVVIFDENERAVRELRMERETNGYYGID